ncbi:S1C family serine protease [Miltoncostaea oceani]|uniref:S1C family serine protease n=1 Tax=Miltoncostaea oceani TaxID=2843216 RepID=UPI001C3C29D5|nr:trypsin-like peptidase domain-containing protein [Miltoncostaea oceani]
MITGVFAALTVCVATLCMVVIGPSDLRGETVPRPAFDPQTLYQEAAGSIAFIESVGADGQAGSGSGFVVEGDRILTNEHVVSDARSVMVSFPSDREPRVATVVGVDVSADLALLKVNQGTLPPALSLGSATDLSPGQPILVIGAPFGLELSASTGIVSALNRQIVAPDGLLISNTIQTDAAVNPGNSGGPLLDAEGRVVGVATQIADAGNSANVGVAFAVPSDLVERNLRIWLDGGQVERPGLGIQVAEAPGGAGGVVITGFDAGSPLAGKAGVNDVIRGIDDLPVRGIAELLSLLSAYQPGDRVELDISSGGELGTVEVALVRRDAPADAG